jgi:hypothetical protein
VHHCWVDNLNQMKELRIAYSFYLLFALTYWMEAKSFELFPLSDIASGFVYALTNASSL